MPNYWIDHVHLTSQDPSKTAEFYEKSLGAKNESIKFADGRTLISLAFGEASVLVTPPRPQPLIPNTLPDGCGLEHFGLGTDNIEEAIAELKANGIKVAMEITAINPTTKVAFIVSPEGILIELVEHSE